MRDRERIKSGEERKINSVGGRKKSGGKIKSGVGKQREVTVLQNVFDTSRANSFVKV